MIGFFRSLYFSGALFYSLFGIALLFLLSYWFEFLYSPTWVLASLLLGLVFLDILLLYKGSLIFAKRILPEKFSNSDDNRVNLRIENRYPFQIKAEIIDEIPEQFQKRDFLRRLEIGSGESKGFQYMLRPVERGEYYFGNLNIFVLSWIGLAKRKYVFDSQQMLKVYPSFLQMKKLDFLAIDKNLSLAGIKRIRRIGHTMEFEQIKAYVRGDDVRTINWKATAKHKNLMVNQFQDERAQPVYSVIDCGRAMKMPFKGLSLLDYAINSSLAFSNVVLKKKDRAGLVSFSNKLHHILKANAKATQLSEIMEGLYNIETGFLDSDFGLLYTQMKNHLSQRSLIMLYTNFEHPSSLSRQLSSLKALARKHLLVVIFFENTEIKGLQDRLPANAEESAHQVIAEEYAQNKQSMLKELQRHGIQAVLTSPGDLSINTINKYLEIKARGIL